MARKLASIQKILSLSPIEGADNIEVARVMGWNVVVKRGEFNVGDFVVYCEIDSVLPERPEFEFLRKNNFRIRTMKLRGQISQGICFPTSVIHDAQIARYGFSSPFPLIEGEDWTDALDITKYEPLIHPSLAGNVKGLFPGFISKTDETRVQVLQDVLDRHKGKEFYVTEKLDGSSTTMYVQDDEFNVCSRNLNLKESDSNAFWIAARQNQIEEKIRKINNIYAANHAIQAELIGPGIQGNKYKRQNLEIFVFNIFNMDESRYLDYDEMVEVSVVAGFNVVPMLGSITLDNNIDNLVDLSKDKSKLYDVWREGIVLRPIVEESDPDLGRLSFKVINPQFLLKYGDD